jgi:sec-independent protein translocase protein TatA
MPNIGPLELVIVLVVFMMIFGVGRLPEVGGAIGRGIAEFRKGASAQDSAAGPDEVTEKQSEDDDE